MKSAKTLITASIVAAVAFTVLGGGVASASTGESDHNPGHCHHVKHGKGHAYGHRNHDHSCDDSDASSPDTSVPADVPPSIEDNEQDAPVTALPIGEIVNEESPTLSELAVVTTPAFRETSQSESNNPLEVVQIVEDVPSSSVPVSVQTPDTAKEKAPSVGRRASGDKAQSNTSDDAQGNLGAFAVTGVEAGSGTSLFLLWILIALAIIAEVCRRIFKAHRASETHGVTAS